ncbi:unnamed protein product [Pieris brassicae]|uniref:Protein CASC3 n=1 Tax=Pieris brassicae TaxID=7116 RepID=A0A9P0SXL0_PIEBR|nr:unnamed protein product [Pieris brassicae]
MTSVARRREQDDSGEYSDASQEIEQNNSGNDAPQQSDYDSQGSDAEHSDRDPEAQEAEKRVDDDEDRSNPQYIPKRGTFYEHDDRTAASGEESSNTTSETTSEKKEEPAAERRRAPRKSETVNKWSHDKFNENEQMPKSKDELVSIYGYDIRNEDAPPHARRNRRYGRGPNKYTRTWEDEEAYKRQAIQAAHKKPPSPSDFPELNAVNKPGRKPRVPRPRSKSQPASNDSSENGSLRRNASIKAKSRPNPVAKANTSTKEKMPPLENLTITTVINNNQNSQPLRKVNATIGQQAPVSTDLAKRKPAPLQNAQSSASKQSQQKPAQNQQNPQGTGENRGGSKRYSSLRQRPLAEPYSPQNQQQNQSNHQNQFRHHGEFAPGANQNNTQQQGSPAAQMHSQQVVHQTQLRNANATTQQGHGPSPPHQPVPNQPLAQQQVRLGLMEQQPMVPHGHHAMHNMPQPHNIGQIQAPQAYAPPAMMPAQYMQQSGSGAVYGGAMYQPPQYPPHQMYPHHNYPAPGGLTYYSCSEQEQPPRPQRRPTAAIPIVRPAIPERPPNSEKDNIDRIVENMFVRKPWPATHDAKDKEKSLEPQSKDSSQPNSLTSSSISTDSKTEEKKEIVQEAKEIIQEPKEIQEVQKESQDSQKESQEETERETEA